MSSSVGVRAGGLNASAGSFFFRIVAGIYLGANVGELLLALIAFLADVSSAKPEAASNCAFILGSI